MADRIEKGSKGIYVKQDGGLKVHVIGDRVWGDVAEKEKFWHHKGQFTEPLTLPQAYDIIDPCVDLGEGVVLRELSPRLAPTAIMMDGKVWFDGRANVITYGDRKKLVKDEDDVEMLVPDPVILGNIRTGCHSVEDWLEMNPDATDGIYTRSKRWDVTPPIEVFQMIHDKLKEETGTDIKVSSMGVLGKGGKDGVWATIKLPAVHGDIINYLGTGVDEYMTIFIDHMGSMYVIQTNVLTVCYNTWQLGLARASREFKVDHRNGALGRLTEAFQDVWNGFIDGRRMVHDAMIHLRGTDIETDLMKAMVDSAFPYPNEPLANFKGKRSEKERWGEYFRKVEQTNARRDFAMMAWEDPQKIQSDYDLQLGVVEGSEGTGFAGVQIITGINTYAPTRSIDNWRRSMLKGDLGRSTRNAISTAFAGGDYTFYEQSGERAIRETDAGWGEGVDYPDSIRSFYAEEFETADVNDGIFNPFSTHTLAVEKLPKVTRAN